MPPMSRPQLHASSKRRRRPHRPAVIARPELLVVPSSSLVSSRAGAARRAAARSWHQPRVAAARMPNAGNAGQLEMENGGGVAGDGRLGRRGRRQ